MKKIAIAMVLVLAACSTNDEDAKDASNGTNSHNNTNNANNGNDGGADQKIIPDLSMDDDAAATCGEGIYPCGVYGTRKGDVIENDVFFGYSDPQTFCKKVEQRQLDLDNKVRMEFGSWYQKPDGCDKKKLLWVMVSAGWCGPCVMEIQEVMDQIKGGTDYPLLDLVDILFETDKGDPVTEKFAKEKWATTTGLTFPLLLDPEFKMGKYFDAEAVPFNMLVDLETMEVVYSQTGSNMQMMAAQVEAFFHK